MHALRYRLSTAFVWALVSLTMVSGIPRIGCICADGQHKLFCGKHLASACSRAGLDDSDSCPCCHKSDLVRKSVPGPARSCCGQDAKVPPGATVSKTCCTRYLVSLVVPTVAKAVSAPHPLPEWTVLEFVPAPGMISAATPEREILRNPDLPVPDLVIAHQVFVI